MTHTNVIYQVLLQPVKSKFNTEKKACVVLVVGFMIAGVHSFGMREGNVIRKIAQHCKRSVKVMSCPVPLPFPSPHPACLESSPFLRFIINTSI